MTDIDFDPVLFRRACRKIVGQTAQTQEEQTLALSCLALLTRIEKLERRVLQLETEVEEGTTA